MKKRLVAIVAAAGFTAYFVSCFVAFSAAFTGNAWAASSSFAQMPAKNRQTHKYTCGATGKILQVTYWNTANGQSFAFVPVKGQQLLFVNTIAASGAKYQAGSYTWWTKGPRADLVRRNERRKRAAHVVRLLHHQPLTSQR
ncbi:MAG: Formate dehydrogenase -O, gamma subunit (EC [uncultured Paraburkholderia sp.]|nr:MAG: Formate dehydrogenase -O, gamma subunit (EC [uncultured Paraburkholderia sp.]CAH2932403.1 MAG: Formate dehydrogenase -O, gamma subunit (EC [uncultured Paraburkholderia sp.]